jgi:hypothetical protein
VEVNSLSRTRLLGAVVALVALFGGFVALNSGAALAAGPEAGPNIQSTAPGFASLGGNVLVQLSTTDAVAPNPLNGYNMGLVYDSTALVPVISGTFFGPGTFPTGDDLGNNAGISGLNCPAAPNGNDPSLGVGLPAPLQLLTFGCIFTGSTSNPLLLSHATFQTLALGVTAVHKVGFAEVGSNAGLCAGVCTATFGSDGNGVQLNTYSCPGATFPAGPCGPLPVAGSTAADNVIDVVNSAPILTAAKTFSKPSVVAGGEAFNITLTLGNSASSTVNATNATISDTIDPLIPIANVTLPAPCTNVLQVVTCTAASIAPGATVQFVLAVSATDPNAGGNTIANHACANAANNPPPAGTTPASAQVCSTPVNLQIIPPAVAWSKSPTSGNLFETTGSQTYSFDEIMTNQGDPNGLGGFSFDVHYDPTIFNNPVIDESPAIALFANPTAHGATGGSRVLTCNHTILGNGIDHVLCTSTGTFGSGPQWTGAEVMAHVTLTPLEIVTEQVRPNKENGIVTPVKDTNTTVTNTCGQPLNDGTIHPIPGQPECQGNPLQGVGPGGVINDSMTTVTIRRLEGDVTKDCTVDVSDMQNEASRFGMSTGNLLYNVFYDVNLPLQHGDGEIDINDIQFVYGRMGSTCASPIPAQPAQALP